MPSFAGSRHKVPIKQTRSCLYIHYTDGAEDTAVTNLVTMF